ncbi:MAG: hypothetical protein KF847_18735 [Pirellulales bacterium]|nr:hypothetical protein [Pirellulales bacterium]
MKWDAWNRLIEVHDGTNTVQKNEYDGQNKRIVREKLFRRFFDRNAALLLQ